MFDDNLDNEVCFVLFAGDCDEALAELICLFVMCRNEPDEGASNCNSSIQLSLGFTPCLTSTNVRVDE
jgi:hypothetical protein